MIQWTPSNDELEEGVNFINEYAPERAAKNEQTLCALVNIKPNSGTSPEHKVRIMRPNKSKGLGGAVSMTDFPLAYSAQNPSCTRFCYLTCFHF